MAEADFKLEIGTQSWFSIKVCGLDKKKKKSELGCLKWQQCCYTTQSQKLVYNNKWHL